MTEILCKLNEKQQEYLCSLALVEINSLLCRIKQLIRSASTFRSYNILSNITPTVFVILPYVVELLTVMYFCRLQQRS